jgi:hypothetical protein
MQFPKRLALCLMLFQISAVPSFAASRGDITAAVESRYRITTLDFLGNIKEVGSVLVVQQEGLKADRPKTLFRPNIVENRLVVTAGGGELPLPANVDGQLKPGGRLYLQGIKAGDDYVELALFTVKSFLVPGSGTRGPTPLQATTMFLYDGGLGKVSVRQVMDDIGLWFSTEGEAKVTSVVESGGGHPEAATRTVRLGQTEAEVTAIFGAPDKIILLGAKSVLVYGKLKVIFIDGRVADAE